MKAHEPMSRTMSSDAPADAAAGLERVQQEHQREREQQVRAAEDHRFRRAETGDVHVVQRHRDGDGRHGPLEPPGLGRGCGDFVGYDWQYFRHAWLLYALPTSDAKTGRPRPPRDYAAGCRGKPTSLPLPCRTSPRPCGKARRCPRP